jgi:uncharacterized phage protein gp47/JayE
MAEIPKFEGPDLTLREEFIFSTTISSRFFGGTMDADTVDMQVSIRGAAFTSDPDLIAFEGSDFVVPNPSAYPNGLKLLPGDNIIEVKSVLTNGAVTAPGKVTARLVQERDVRGALTSPSGISIERFDRTISVTIEGLTDSDVVGYHFYGSTSPGGGTSGYNRINPALVISSTAEEVFTAVGELTTDANIATNNDGTHAADPLFVRVSGVQEDGNEVVLQTDFDQLLEINELTSRLRTTTTIEQVRTINRFSFVHDRQANFNSATNPAIPNASFSAIPSEDPVYYVVTAVYNIDGDEFESSLSPEVSGSPLVITPTVGVFPAVSRQQIVRDTVLSIFRSQPQLDVKPGSVVRDTFIDPFSTEAQRIRFIVDFLHRAQSFSTLLPIDDPGFTGTSLPVAQSEYKRALKLAFYLENDQAVQNVIDGSIDKLASNFGKTRRAGKRARGAVTIFTRTRPTTSINFPVGTGVTLGGQRFRLTSPVSIAASGSGSFFNPATGRYSATAFIQAEQVGLAGNIAPSIGTVDNAPLGISAQNEAPTFGGDDVESNRTLALRAQGALSSVDSGTLQGYTQTTIDVPGVEQVNVADAGHPLMMRDRNDAGVHVGGKVDIWVRGESTGEVTDAFAFTFEIAERVQFEPVGDLADLKFRAVDPNLSVANPIIEMLSIPAYGFEFRNESEGYTFDLTNVTIVGWNSIQLDSTLNDPTAHDLEDVITGYYRYRTSDKFVFTRQPVRSIESFVGQRSSTIGAAAYDLFKVADPLLEGLTNEAGDYIQITDAASLADDVVIPSPIPVTVTGESHVILDGVEYLDLLGANPLTVRVFNSDRSVEYDSPFASDSPDFTFVEGSPTVALGIQVTDLSDIVSGQTILIDYSHDENFSVSYIPNVLIDVAQDTIDPRRHLTADVLVKEAIAVPVDITATVVLQNSQDRTLSASQVDGAIRTELARYFGGLSLGEPIRPADISRAIDGVEGVSYPVHPLTKVVKGEGAYVIREGILTSQNSDILAIAEWHTPTVKVWLLKDEITAATTDGGGPITKFRAVHADEERLLHFENPPNINGIPLNNSLNSTFIIGDDGLNIPGYTDDTTLLANFVFDSDPDVKEAQLATKRRELTKNRVLVTLPNEVGAPTPKEFTYRVTYIVGTDTGTKGIEPGPAEYLTVGLVDLSFDQDYDFRARVLGRRGG